MIPVIMKGETSKPIQLALKEGYEYSGCALHVNFCGLRDTFVDLAAGGSVELRYTAEQTARLPLGTSKVMLSIENARNEICFMPWAKIKVTDCPEDVRDAQITIDPATLNVEDLTTKDTLASVKSRLNAVMAFLRGLSLLAVLALPLYALSDVAPLTAPLDDIPGDTPIMTNVVPYVDAKVAAVPAPDYSTGNAALVATIEATAPAPGDYETVSNKAMSALQEHQSLWPAVEASTNYTDAVAAEFENGARMVQQAVFASESSTASDSYYVGGHTASDLIRASTNAAKAVVGPVAVAATNYTDAALGTFAETGAVARAAAYGTTERWTDSHGRVWEKAYSDWDVEYDDPDMAYYGVRIVATGQGDGAYWIPYVGDSPAGVAKGNADSTEIVWLNDAITDFKATRAFLGATNLVGRVALTNEIPDVSGYTTPADVTAAIREQSLGGIWDQELEVWWTPKMRNGALRYETNAVQNAADTLAVVSNIVASGGLASVDTVDAKISTNNAAFVSAVLAVPLAGADAGDLAEIAEYGGYGTVGAALLALIAGLAALKRRVTSAETALAGKMPMYPMVAVTPSSGTLTVTPYTVATYTADTSAAAFTVAVGTGTAGMARDCELVIDCTATGAVAPTVTWPATFHPRTDAATDFACEAGVRNVYFISEYAAGEFAVGGWQETAGGNT